MSSPLDPTSVKLAIETGGVAFRNPVLTASGTFGYGREFEGLIYEELRDIGACVDRAVAAAGLTPDQIDVVLRTGGSSSIPAFLRLLEARFGAAKIRKQDVFTGIAAGLGIAGWRSLHDADTLPLARAG